MCRAAEGIKGASLPPPGVYFRDYNYFYWADQFNNPSGNDAHGPQTSMSFTYANIPRVIWITDTKFLGGYRRRGRPAAAGLSTSVTGRAV